MSFNQVGVVPFRRSKDGRRCKGGVEVLLITSRTRGRWICPKGNVEDEHGARGSARLEAFEEAGVAGRLVLPVLGSYRHGDPPRPKVCIWLLEVEEEHDTWPEGHERRRQWLPLAEAQQTVDEEGLARLLTEAARRLAPEASAPEASAP